jgi:ATP-dependent Clp protease ATP-binding subunit ClpA
MKHNWIGTEHLLLGLIREENTIAAKCLRNFSVDFGKAHKEVLNVIDGSNSGRTVSRGKDARAAPEGLPFTPHLRTVAQAARIDAEQHDYAEPALEHYLIAIVRARQGVAWEALQLCGAKPAQIIAELAHRLQSARDADPKSLHAPGEARQILAQARAIAAEKKHRWLGTEHLLLAILSETTNYPGKCLRSLGLDLESVSPVVTRLLNNCPSSLSPNRLPDALQKGLRSAGALEGLMDSGVSGSVELGRLVSNLRGALDLLWVCLQECVYVEVRIDGDAAIAAEVLAVDPNAVVTEMKAGTVELLYKGLPEDLEPVLRKLVGAAPIFSFSVDKITPENTSEAVARLLDMKR